MQKIVLFFLFWTAFATGFGQINITGATCTLQGTQYQYRIDGGQDSSTAVQVCVTGGVLTGADSTCLTGTGIYRAQVTWDAETGVTGTLTVTIGSNTQTLNVTIAPQLNGGSIDTALKNQFIDSAATPATIVCSAASGGACSPVFSYQWQYSADNLAWTDITDATSQNLGFSGALSQSGYYRRKVFENTSGSIGYSDAAVIFLQSTGTGFLIEQNMQQEKAGIVLAQAAKFNYSAL